MHQHIFKILPQRWKLINNNDNLKLLIKWHTFTDYLMNDLQFMGLSFHRFFICHLILQIPAHNLFIQTHLLIVLLLLQGISYFLCCFYITVIIIQIVSKIENEIFIKKIMFFPSSSINDLLISYIFPGTVDSFIVQV